MKARNILLASTLGLAAFTAAPAMAQTDSSYVGGDTTVRGNDLTRTPQVDADTEGGSLPVTGGDIAGLVAIGVASVGAGTVLVRRSRRSANA